MVEFAEISWKALEKSEHSIKIIQALFHNIISNIVNQTSDLEEIRIKMKETGVLIAFYVLENGLRHVKNKPAEIPFILDNLTNMYKLTFGNKPEECFHDSIEDEFILTDSKPVYLENFKFSEDLSKTPIGEIVSGVMETTLKILGLEYSVSQKQSTLLGDETNCWITKKQTT
ncbi:MAG: hypothetical protein ACTSUV_01715 [Candidatus Ranarchaeia archaeon]